jgi:ABC-type phosphate transport system permease subunit
MEETKERKEEFNIRCFCFFCIFFMVCVVTAICVFVIMSTVVVIRYSKYIFLLLNNDDDFL